MKKIKLKMLGLVLFVAAGFTACSNDDEPQKVVTKKSFVTEVTGPTTGKINQELSLEVSFTVENNCGTFNKFVENTVENTKTIEVESKFEGIGCDATPLTKQTPYKFKATAEGTYILKFKKSETEFITQTIIISPEA
ncbi:hypothetical protein [Flavobacterium granuli]|uniref:GOLD domain-containing protein n=1 Tax=Flavobacterium granuli TaxID=280093 RepID=A0A1M5KAH0_9FLAO|nr:hypothetical protein [Flavobacterium granuli]PRZ26223.1 hypothetical protein BC624_102186 [Flavobacterium granuli]SHG49836.1 hypothetical protein SAMN05443373_102186 [Flavobacterium granuli]